MSDKENNVVMETNGDIVTAAEALTKISLPKTAGGLGAAGGVSALKAPTEDRASFDWGNNFTTLNTRWSGNTIFENPLTSPEGYYPNFIEATGNIERNVIPNTGMLLQACAKSQENVMNHTEDWVFTMSDGTQHTASVVVNGWRES